MVSFCVIFQIEGPQLMQHGFADAIAKVGLHKFISDLFWIGLFYHLYNQVTNTVKVFTNIAFIVLGCLHKLGVIVPTIHCQLSLSNKPTKRILPFHVRHGTTPNRIYLLILLDW